MPVRPGTQAWRPDPRVSLATAGGGLVLVTALFVSLLRHPPEAEPAGPRLGLRVQQAGIAPRRVREAPQPRRPQAALPLVTPVAVPLLPGQDFHQFLMDAAVAPEADAGVLRRQAPAVASDLQRVLLQRKPADTLPDGQSFRIAGGGRMVRSGDNCAMERTISGSSSPTNRPTVAAPVDCPGSGRDDFDAWLEKWAVGRAQQAPVPPR